MFVTSKEMLLKAQSGKYAVGAFNAENMEMVMAIIKGAEELSAPVIIQTTPSTLKYAQPSMFRAMVYDEAVKAKVPVCLHLDHGDSFELAEKAFNAGYSSLMIDGSKEEFENNIELTKKVIKMAKEKNIPVEAELGSIGGKEDDLSANARYTDPKQAEIFANETQVDSLAIAIGTAHGVYKSVPKLDVGRLKEIRKVVSVPIVLHGASGLSVEAIRDCVENGVCKVNFATELRIAYTEAVREFLKNDDKAFDPKKYGVKAMEKVKEVVKEKIMICKCDNKA